MNELNIAIIGGGLTGLTTACKVLEWIPSAKISVFSEKFTPNTSSDTSTGFWTPLCFSEKDCTSPNLITKCGKETYEKFIQLCSSPQASEFNGQIISSYVLSDSPDITEPSWAKFVLQYKKLDETEMKLLGFSQVSKSGLHFISTCVEMSKYLSYLMKELKDKGVKFNQTKITNLSQVMSEPEMKNVDFIINCSGGGARDLVSDNNVFTVEDHLIKFDAPWVKHSVVHINEKNGFTYVVPVSKIVIAGELASTSGKVTSGSVQSTKEQHGYDRVLNNCSSMIPSLKNAKILDKTFGIWPCRNGGLRLELENVTIQNTTVKVIHNYGHGASGVSLSWGCASEVAQLIKNQISKNEKQETHIPDTKRKSTNTKNI